MNRPVLVQMYTKLPRTCPGRQPRRLHPPRSLYVQQGYTVPRAWCTHHKAELCHPAHEQFVGLGEAKDGAVLLEPQGGPEALAGLDDGLGQSGLGLVNETAAIAESLEKQQGTFRTGSGCTVTNS
jgi:hypothetical protein